MIAGDVHMSGFSNLFEESVGFAFQQIVTSAVRSTPISAAQMLVIKGLLAANSTVGSSGESPGRTASSSGSGSTTFW